MIKYKNCLESTFYCVFFVVWVVGIASLNAYAISAIEVKNTKGSVLSLILIVLWWILTIVFNVIDKKIQTNIINIRSIV